MLEDEPLIVDLMTEALTEAGYHVMAAGDGVQALQLIEQHPHHFSALFSDYQLPGHITGIDVARLVRRRYPTIPVILATGRPDLLDAYKTPARNFRLLSKPYRPSELLELMNAMVPPGHRPTR